MISSGIWAGRKVEETLLTSDEKFRGLFEDCTDVVFFSTPEGELLDINPASVELFGYASHEEMLQINIEAQLFADAEQRRRYRQLLSGNGYVKDFEFTWKAKTGHVCLLQLTTTAIRDAEGNAVAYRGILRDVTNLRQLQQQLENVRKMQTMGRLASRGVAHNMYSILTSIAGSCELMKLKVLETDALYEEIRHVEEAVQEGMSLTRQLL